MILWVFWVNDTLTQVLYSKTLCNVNSTNYWYIQPQTSKWTSESMWMNLFVSRTKRLKSLNYKSVLISMPAKTEGMIAVFLYSIVHTSAHVDWTTSVQLEMMLCHNVERYDAFIDLWDSLSVSDMMLWACGPRFAHFLPLIESMCQALSA